MSNHLDTLTSFTPDTISVTAETLFVANTYDAAGNLKQVLSWTDPAPIEERSRTKDCSPRIASSPTRAPANTTAPAPTRPRAPSCSAPTSPRAPECGDRRGRLPSTA